MTDFFGNKNFDEQTEFFLPNSTGLTVGRNWFVVYPEGDKENAPFVCEKFSN